MINMRNLINDAQREVRQESMPATDRQYAKYVELARMKYVKIQKQDVFNMKTISEEITRLIAMPNAYPMSAKQKAKILELCETLKVKVPDMTGWSNIQASDVITKLLDNVPPTENQLRRLVNFYRFGIIDDISDKLSSAMASKLIEDNQTDYYLVSEGKLTLNQSLKIQELELYAQGVDIEKGLLDLVRFDMFVNTYADKVTDIRKLSALSFEDASERIEALDAERKAMHDVVKSETRYSESIDSSRNTDEEDYEKLSFGDKEYAAKLTAYHGLKRELGQQWDEDDSVLNEDNIDEQLKALMKLALVVCDEKVVYGIVMSADKAVTAKATDTVKKANKKTATKARKTA